MKGNSKNGGRGTFKIGGGGGWKDSGLKKNLKYDYQITVEPKGHPVSQHYGWVLRPP